MRRLVLAVAVAALVPSCIIGPRPVRHSINGSLLGAGATLAVATALNPCAMHEPGLLNFDDLCRGINNGAIAFGVAMAAAGLLGLVTNAFPDDTTHSKE
jgi:hypothetical protein